jgi:hypothetical protein
MHALLLFLWLFLFGFLFLFFFLLLSLKQPRHNNLLALLFDGFLKSFT